MTSGRGADSDSHDRLIFPLLAEPTPRPRWVNELIVGAVIVAMLSIAVLAAVSQLRPAPSGGKLAVGAAGPDSRHPDRTAAGGRVQAGVFELSPGTCLRAFEEGTAVREVRIVPCHLEHRAEAVATLRMPDGAWPGRSAVDEFAAERCVRAIREAGVPPARSLKWSYFGPSASSWDVHGDRAVTCLVVGTDVPLMGSLIAGTSGRSGGMG